MATYKQGKQVFTTPTVKSNVCNEKCVICKEPLGLSITYKLLGDEENQKFKRAHVKCLGKK